MSTIAFLITKVLVKIFKTGIDVLLPKKQNGEDIGYRKEQDMTSYARSKVEGQWSSGYNVALTTRRSPVQFRPGPLFLFYCQFSSNHFQIG